MYQYERVHAHGLYDIEVDTSVLDIDACVKKIVEVFEREHSTRAFSQLRLISVKNGSNTGVMVG
jgi:hypothetical protein